MKKYNKNILQKKVIIACLAVIIISMLFLVTSISLNKNNAMAEQNELTIQTNEESNIMPLNSDGKKAYNVISGRDVGAEDVTTISLSDLTDVSYIDNNYYFLINPQHHGGSDAENKNGTCTTTAMQLLLGYHNYYSDRRLIPSGANNYTFLSNFYGDVQYDTSFEVDNLPIESVIDGEDEGCNIIGTEADVFNAIYNLTNNPSGTFGQTIGNVADGARAFVNTYSASEIRSNITINNGLAVGNNLTTVALGELIAGRPVILAMNPFNDLNGFHVVVAYGYAKLDGEEGFLVHYGWGASITQAWVAKGWFLGYITMSVNHTHTYQDTGINVNGTHRKVTCSVCGRSTAQPLYNFSNGTISGTNYPVQGTVELPSQFQIYSKNTNVFNTYPVQNVSTSLFKNNTNLTSITIPSSVTVIPAEAFMGCTSLTSITLPSTVTSIGYWAFSSCSSLTTIQLPNSLTSIGQRAFSGCSSLTTIQLPNSLTSIGQRAFSGCTNLESITIPALVTTIGSGAFSSCNNLDITVNSNNPDYVAEGNIVYKVAYNQKTQIVASGDVASTVNVPSSVTSILYGAFMGNSNITTVIFNGNTSLESSAFFNCDNLSEIYYYLPRVPTFESGCFNTINIKVYVPSNKLQEFTTLYGGYGASVRPVNITLSYMSDGVVLSSRTMHNNRELIIPHKLTKTGYTFLGWYDNAEYTGSSYNDGDIIDSIGNLTLYAKWVENDYTITFNGNGGTPSEDTQGVAYTYTVSSLPTALKTGHTFTGWNTQADGLGENITAPFIYQTAGDITLYAQYEQNPENTYNVSLDTINADSGQTIVLATYGQAMPTATIPTKLGYTFNGYYTEQNGQGIKYYNADMSSARSWDIEQDTTLYAYWTETIYTATFDHNFEGNVDVETFTFSSGVSGLPIYNTGDVFIYWLADDGTIYFDGEMIYANKDINLTAIYLEPVYITLVSNEVIIYSQTFDLISGDSLQLPELVDGFDYVSHWGDYVAGQTYVFTDSLILYAVWV